MNNEHDAQQTSIRFQAQKSFCLNIKRKFDLNFWKSPLQILNSKDVTEKEMEEVAFL